MIVKFAREKIRPGLPGIIVMSHGPLAMALIETAAMVLGDSENVAAFSVEANDDLEEYRNAFTDAYENLPEGTVFLIDIYGGTPYNQLMQYIMHSDKEVPAVTGVNLGMLIEAISNRDSISGVKLIDELEDVAKDGIKNISMILEAAGRSVDLRRYR